MTGSAPSFARCEEKAFAEWKKANIIGKRAALSLGPK